MDTMMAVVAILASWVSPASPAPAPAPAPAAPAPTPTPALARGVGAQARIGLGVEDRRTRLCRRRYSKQRQWYRNSIKCGLSAVAQSTPAGNEVTYARHMSVTSEPALTSSAESVAPVASCACVITVATSKANQWWCSANGDDSDTRGATPSPSSTPTPAHGHSPSANPNTRGERRCRGSNCCKFERQLRTKVSPSPEPRNCSSDMRRGSWQSRAACWPTTTSRERACSTPRNDARLWVIAGDV